MRAKVSVLSGATIVLALGLGFVAGRVTSSRPLVPPQVTSSSGAERSAASVGVLSLSPGGFGLGDGRIFIEGALRGATLRLGHPVTACAWSIVQPQQDLVVEGGSSAFLKLPMSGLFVSRRCGEWIGRVAA